LPDADARLGQYAVRAGRDVFASRGDVMTVIETKRLRPAGATHGHPEMQRMTGEYMALEGHDQHMAIASKLIPVVMVVRLVTQNGSVAGIQASVNGKEKFSQSPNTAQ
jgi:hypothetical protein